MPEVGTQTGRLSFLLALVLALSPLATATGAERREVEADGVVLSLELDSVAITTAQRIACRLQVTAPADVVTRFSETGGRMGELRVRRLARSPERLLPGGRRTTSEMRWELEPYLPGTVAVPSLVVEYRNRGESGSPWASLATPEIELRVSSVLAPGVQGPVLRDLAPSLRAYERWLPLLLLVVVFPLGMAWFFRRRHTEDAQQQEDARNEAETAEALAQLQGWSAEGQRMGVQVASSLDGMLRRFLLARNRNGQCRGRTLGEIAAVSALGAPAHDLLTRLAAVLERSRYGRGESAREEAVALLEGFLFEVADKGGCTQ
ncbi:MAG: hypothetical protein ACC661_00700 [Verrucomicrobiales bacterium]